MHGRQPVFLGLDLGSQGVRGVIVDRAGAVVSSLAEQFPWEVGVQQQDPAVWLATIDRILGRLALALRDLGLQEAAVALSVTSTSGTVLPLDRDHQPIWEALMYNDRRASAQANRCRDVLGPSINVSFGLPKMVWFCDAHPNLAARVHVWAHPADYVIAHICGVHGVTDHTTATKSGYDLERGRWRPEIALCGIDVHHLPRVVSPGTPIARISKACARETGLPDTVVVVAGMTDGCASQVAAGCVSPGDWSTTIGTTMVLKGVTPAPVHDPEGRVYNHLHPDGHWMPGGASNTGADWVARDYRQTDLDALSERASAYLPTDWISYPLLQRGERFPFVAPEATGFDHGGLTADERFAARMEGVAYIERMAVSLLESLSGAAIPHIRSAGGATRNRVWCQIRSNVLGRPVIRTAHSSGAVGAAIIAASKTQFGSLAEAGQELAQVEDVVFPEQSGAYEQRYAHFVDQLARRGYVHGAGDWKVSV
jgi:sugar (pentulose or hexulose) kinase